MLNSDDQQAPGHPGIPARWTSSAKSGVGTALNPSSRVWFTLSHGIFDEIYYPRVDQACIRDMGLLITDRKGFFSEEKRDTNHEVAYLNAGIPAYQLTNTCAQGRYQITKIILTDPQRDVVLQQTDFQPLQGLLEDYQVYVLLSPHLGNQGAGNNAWLGDYKGIPMLFAERDNLALALAASTPWLKRSVGYVGFSDGWQDLNNHKEMTWQYSHAPDGNVALTGELDILASQGKFVLALGFGMKPAEAGQRALASLLTGFEQARKIYVGEWKRWHRSVSDLGEPQTDLKINDIYRISAAVLKTHEAKRFPGGLIASLAIPWGFAKGDEDLGGYHLVWPRDLVEAAGGLLAIGARDDARRVLHYLRVTQEAEGHWPQNMWLDGRPYWSGIQMDETAFPILLVDLARREGALTAEELATFWPMVRRAASFIVGNGPVTQQDRWEEDPGYSPFTLAVEVAALLAAAEIAEYQGANAEAGYLRDTADTWNENIERWSYATGTDLAKQHNIDGYYVRISPPEEADAASPVSGFVPIKNRPPQRSYAKSSHMVSPDALALVRFGLRAPDDPRILNTIKIIDDLLRVDTPSGPAWHRYNDDGYGEQEDGNPFNGTGIGRAWPLLTGERAHYELSAGRPESALRLLHTLENFVNAGGMIPEQIWDAPDIPEKELFFGKPSGSAMPLVWAHAEYIKLCRSLQDKQVFDTPEQTVDRYIKKHIQSQYSIWRFNHKVKSIPAGKTLRIEARSPAIIHWTSDGWETSHDDPTIDTHLSVHFVDVPTEKLPPHACLSFTLYWPDEDRWEGKDFTVMIEPA